MDFNKSLSTNLLPIAEDYIKLMSTNIQGMKGLIFDSETKVIFSLITSKSLAVKEEIFMFDEIQNLKQDEKYLNIKGVFFLRPTEQNVDFLIKILKEPNFSDIYITFSNTLTEDLLQKIAFADVYASIKSIQEVFLDYYIVNNKLLHFDVDSTFMLKNLNSWSSTENFIIKRIVDGIFGVCMSLRLNPIIKIIKGNSRSNFIAQKVIDKLYSEAEFIQRNCSAEPNGTLILFDRKEDPVTPLLTQWTYQAMIHETFSIHQNITKVKDEKLVLSSHEDSFFCENLDKVFADVAMKIKEKIDSMQSNDGKDNMDSFEDIKKYIENLPQKKKESMEITKHTSIVYELTNMIENRKLLEISSLEQDIACKDDKKDHFNRIIEILKNPNKENNQQIDKIKLYLLFCLRYEQDTNCINTLKQLLKDTGLGDYADYSDILLSYAGQSKRKCDLFGNKDFLSSTFTKFTQAFKDIPNVFTQHRSLLSNLIKKLISKSGKSNNDFETMNPGKSEKLNKIFIFNLGGATYEEAKDLNEISVANKIEIFFGGTNIINSKHFLNYLNEMALLGKKFN